MWLKILLFSLLFSQLVSAQVVTEPIDPTIDPATTAQINAMSQEIKQIHVTIDTLPNRVDLDTRIADLEVKLNESNNSKAANEMANMIGVLLVNDLLILGGIILIRLKAGLI